MRAALTLLVFAVLASPAAASTARVIEPSVCPPGDTCEATLLVRAAAGEANRFTAGGGVVRDDGAPLTAGAGCTQLDARSVRCPVDTELVIEAGDGDDVVTVPPDQPSRVDLGEGDDRGSGLFVAEGGPGDDVLGAGRLVTRLEGGDGDDSLRGGASDDLLIGGPGEDRLVGNAGADRLALADARDADRADGGPGADTVTYDGARAAVTVDLAARRGADGDRLTSVENATGGAGDDRLAGSGGRNTLDGGGGEDRLDGRAGDDRLTGGATTDLTCGAGDDRVLEPDRAVVPRDCERIALSASLSVTAAARPRPEDERFRLALSCPRTLRCSDPVATFQRRRSGLGVRLRLTVRDRDGGSEAVRVDARWVSPRG